MPLVLILDLSTIDLYGVQHETAGKFAEYRGVATAELAALEGIQFSLPSRC